MNQLFFNTRDDEDEYKTPEKRRDQSSNGKSDVGTEASKDGESIQRCITLKQRLDAQAKIDREMNK